MAYKIILTAIIFIGINNICFAEEVNAKVKPKSRIGGTVGSSAKLFEEESSKNIFYNYAISNNSFLSFNAGYRHRKSKFCFFGCSSSSDKDIHITFGINAITNNKRFNPYCGIEVGLLKNEAFYSYSEVKNITNTTLIIVPAIGFFCKLYGVLYLTLNVKGQYGMIEYYDEKYFGHYTSGLNIGLSFSF